MFAGRIVRECQPHELGLGAKPIREIDCARRVYRVGDRACRPSMTRRFYRRCRAYAEATEGYHAPQRGEAANALQVWRPVLPRLAHRRASLSFLPKAAQLIQTVW